MAEGNGIHIPIPANLTTQPTGYSAVIEDLDLPELMIERGTTGLRRSAGYVREEFLTELTGLVGMRTYRQMRDNDPVIGACLFAIEMLLRNVTWRVQPADDSPDATWAAEFARTCLFEDMDMTWSMTLAEILTMLTFGWAYFEMTMKYRNGYQPPQQLDDVPFMPSRYDDGLLGFGKVSIRAQETLLRWEFDTSGGLMGMHQLDPFTGRLAYIPYEKALLFRPTSWKANPEGRSILRNAYRPWYLKNNLENIEGIGIERDLAGLPIAYVPAQTMSPKASADEQAQLAAIKRIVRNVRVDEQHGIVFPSLYDVNGHPLYKFELLSSAGSKQFDTNAVIQRYDLRISQSMLADMIFLGHEAVGSFALASSKTNILSTSLGGYLIAIADIVNRRMVPFLWRVNALPEALMPCFVHGDVESVDLAELGGFVQQYAQAGFDVLDLESYLRQAAGLPEKSRPIVTTVSKRANWKSTARRLGLPTAA